PHGVRGITKQRYPPFAPSLDWITIVECPFVPSRAARVEAQQVGMPAGVSRRQLRHVAFPRPRLLGPRIAVEMRDDVDEFAPSYGVMNDMTMRSHPHRALRNGNVARHRVGGRHPAPADTAGESRCVRAEQALSHNRMNAIG